MFKTTSFITFAATALIATACNHENDRAMTPANGTTTTEPSDGSNTNDGNGYTGSAGSSGRGSAPTGSDTTGSSTTGSGTTGSGTTGGAPAAPPNGGTDH